MKMKRILALALAGVMTLSMGMVAFAKEGDPQSDTEKFTFKKNYVTSSGETSKVYPAETLQFTVTADTANPDTTMITIADTTVDANPDEIEITIPAYSKVGKYNYTVSETAGNTQGVTYSQNSFGVQVLVTYNGDHTELETEVVFTTANGTDGKIDSITNTYDLGALDVSKTVTGNLGSQTKEFEVEVTFTAEKDVKSDITYMDGGEEKTIAAVNLADGTETVTITVKHGETVAFTNIPSGVTYTVKEKDYTEGDANSDNGYDDPKYSVNNGESAVAADGAKGTIGSTKNTVAITNNKGTTVDTGINLDNLPYILMLCIAAFGAAALFFKKRRMLDR